MFKIWSQNCHSETKPKNLFEMFRYAQYDTLRHSEPKVKNLREMFQILRYTQDDILCLQDEKHSFTLIRSESNAG